MSEHDGRTFTDRARDLLEGRLSEDESAALRREIAADSALRSEFESFREVYALTGVVLAPPAPQVTADGVIGRPRGLLRFRPWTIAAAVLLVAAAGLAATALFPGRRDVTLTALSADLSPVPEPTPVTGFGQIPATLAAYEPVVDGRPNWLRSYDEGRAFARESGKPMLVWIEHPTCPLCIELDRETFSDADVQRGLEAFVPVRVDVMDLERDSDLMKRLQKAQAWPYMAAIEADGTTLSEFPGLSELEDVRPQLNAAVARAQTRPTWGQVRVAAVELGQAQEARSESRLADAVAAADRARSALPDGAAAQLRTRAENFEHEFLRWAQSTLVRAAANPDRQSAIRMLDDAARTASGTCAGDDLAAVAGALRETGRFPRLHDRTETHR